MEALDPAEVVALVRGCGLGVVASTGPDGAPQAALVGVAVTDDLELLFDTSTGSRKLANVQRDSRVAVVVGGWDDELTLQAEGRADVLSGEERVRCLAAYVAQWPDGADRAASDEIVLVRVRVRWARVADFRPESFGSREGTFG